MLKLLNELHKNNVQMTLNVDTDEKSKMQGMTVRLNKGVYHNTYLILNRELESTMIPEEVVLLTILGNFLDDLEEWCKYN